MNKNNVVCQIQQFSYENQRNINAIEFGDSSIFC
jgi:hypothetical protein